MTHTSQDVPPQAVIIAGPNGSGKSTAATILLPDGMTFVNADLIAQEITGQKGVWGEINAGRLLIERVTVLEESKIDFAFETTLATKMLYDRLGKWRELGYQVHLIFFWLPSSELAVQRVAARVRDGGHNVPTDTVRRRYARGLKLFFDKYMGSVDSWKVYDNSRDADPVLIAKGNGTGQVILKPELWEQVKAGLATDGPTT